MGARYYELGTRGSLRSDNNGEPFCDGSCVMTAPELQDKLADLAPGETLLLPTIEVEQAFPDERTAEERRAAAIMLAAWYRCSLTLCGPGENQIRFTRLDGLETEYFQ